MRVMAVDYGVARTGVAVSDATGTLTGDAFVIKDKCMGRVARRIVREWKTRGVDRIVVGLPLNMNDTEGESAARCREFAGLIEGLIEDRYQGATKPIMWDERGTTLDAYEVLNANRRYGKKRRERIDAVAASLILESYLASMGKE